MKTRNKVFLLALCAVMLVAVSVWGTIAYLTSGDTVENTFTVGNVVITMDEADTDDSTANADRDKANKYNLIPGKTYTKDPTVHVLANSEDCYVFVTVANGIADLEAASETGGYQSIADQMKAYGWKKLEGETGDEVKLGGSQVYFYKDPIEKKKEVQDLKVFDSFKIDGEKVVGGTKPEGPETPESGKYYLKSYEDAKITVNAYAVQSEGFDSPLQAWTSTFGTD